MKFLVEKIELVDGNYRGKKVRLKLTPASSLMGTFIKLKGEGEDARYIGNEDFEKKGYLNPLHKIPNDPWTGYGTANFYLSFLIGGKKSIDDIQFLDSENFNYEYESYLNELSGQIHLDNETFNQLWDNLTKKLFLHQLMYSYLMSTPANMTTTQNHGLPGIYPS